ncbi:hypothetical protein MAP00_001738 [Monascus purpureus]|nr:hypothetical protein MAP00_001738 [Monascus purpureus]
MVLWWGSGPPRTRRRTAAPAGGSPGIWVSMMASGQRSTDSVSAGDHARAPGLQSPPQTAKHGPRGATAQASFRPNRTPSTGNPVTWVPSTAPRRGSNVALPGGGNRPAAAARRTPGHGAPRQFDRRGVVGSPRS